MGVWKHTESRGFATAIGQALVRAQNARWLTSTANDKSLAVRDVRALMMGTFAIVDTLYSAPGTSTAKMAGESIVFPQPPSTIEPTAERRVAAETLLLTWWTLASMRGWRGGDFDPVKLRDAQISTFNDSDAAPLTGNVVETGWIIQVVGIIAGFTAGTIAVIFCAQKTSELIDRSLSRSEQTQRMLAAHSRAMEVLDKHASTEKAAGKPLPLTEAERAVLDQLKASQDIASKVETPLPTVVPTGTEVAQTVGGFASNTLLLAGAALLAYFALVRSPGRST